MREKITVNKLNLRGELTWRYEGQVIRRWENGLTLEAYFDLDNVRVAGISLQRGDRFVETYYNDRWYNIFEVHDRDGDALKGWYCNISRPASIHVDRLEWIDLFLDLWISADGRQTVLDEEEFMAADLDEETRRAAREPLEALKALFKSKQPPV